MALKRQCRDLMELNGEEWEEFGKIVKIMEKALSDIFKPSLFNWSCFKNAAFRSENPKPEIHWHFIPRYKEPVKYNGIMFDDPDFGHIPRPVTREIPAVIMTELYKLIKSQMEIYSLK